MLKIFRNIKEITTSLLERLTFLGDNFHKSKISTKISIAFAGIILLFILVLILNISMITKISKAKTLLSDSYYTLSLLTNMEKYVYLEQKVQNSVLTTGRMSDSSSQFTLAMNAFNALSKDIKTKSALLGKDYTNKIDDLSKLNKDYSDLFFNSTLKIGKNISNGVASDIETDQQRIDTLKTIDKLNITFKTQIDTLTGNLQKQINNYDKNINYQIKYMIVYFIGAVLIAIVLTILFSLLLSKSILVNINKLRIAAESLGEGNLMVNTELQSNDEIGYLGKVFNNTIINLRSIIEKISTASHSLYSASDQIVSYNNQASTSVEGSSQLMNRIADETQRQQENIEEIHANAGAIASNIKEVLNNVDILLKYANETNQVGSSSYNNVKETINQVSYINNRIHTTSDLIQNLQVKSKDIKSITDIITGVADQTNLLALNASIEAARAGEQGRGFAVVADEIRKLASQVGESSKGILTLVEDINKDISVIYESMKSNTIESEKGIALISKTGEAFETIIKSVNQQLDKISSLSTNMNELSYSFNNINQSISEIVSASENMSASTKNVSDTMSKQLSMSQELSSAAASLARIAQELQELVSIFKI